MRRGAALLLALLAPAAACYYTIALLAALRRARRPSAPNTFCPPVSILKPVCGRDPAFYEAIRSHAAQDYPEFELLFGARDPADAALEDVRRLQRCYPNLAIRIHIVQGAAPNQKVATLIELANLARYPVLLVNDSDVRVQRDYLRRALAPLADPHVGLSTSLYRASGSDAAAQWEALGIATEFAPGVLVARALGVAQFALGSTMAFRAADLRRIGGFESIAQYLADDYQLGARISSLGLRVALNTAVVETYLPAGGWAGAWRHQVRWARTIRASRPGGYYGYFVTHATVWAAVAAARGRCRLAAAVLAVRVAAGIVCGAAVLRDSTVIPSAGLIPLRDLWGFAVWIAGLFGKEVDWRGSRLRIESGGRISPH